MAEPDINNPKFWKCAIFYYNPEDKNRFVARPNGLGLTPNFAHKNIYIILVIALLIVLVFVVFIRYFNVSSSLVG
ncbi:MAG: hypothetical protein ACXVJG_18365 [Mucilaginibacter sp.]